MEDENREYEYENIFNRMFSYRLRISKIFAMKGKEGVKKAFSEYGDTYEEKPAIYIVDGDFDFILEKDMICHKNFIYLDRYNIECYYVDQNAVNKFMAGKMKKMQDDVIKIILYELWERDTYSKLLELFLNYLIAQYCFPSEKNVGISPYNYINDEGYVDIFAVNAYKEQLKGRISNYDELYLLFSNKFKQKLNGDSTRLVCGKYVLASLARYLRKKSGKKFKEEDFRYYLVGEFAIEKLDFLKICINNVLMKDT